MKRFLLFPVLLILVNVSGPLYASASGLVSQIQFPNFEVQGQQSIPVPYNEMNFFYLPSQNVFASEFLDWTHSNSTTQTSHEINSAHYLPLTNGSLAPLVERGFISVGGKLDGVFPNIPNPPSPSMQTVAGRVVIDEWTGTFNDVNSNLQHLAGLGIVNGITIIHNWQFEGYDNELPLDRPANPLLGGDADLNAAIQAGYSAGHLVALHQNYVDYYPNYPYWNRSAIALNSDGSFEQSYFNGTLQADWTKPQTMLNEAITDGNGTYQEFQSNASYIDVNSGIWPAYRVDMDAAQPGAGMMVTFSSFTTQLWQAERGIHQGPAFGEGGYHWYWSGLLDGVEAQFGAGWPLLEGTTAPLLVDFDLLRMHPLQVNHGMGYYSRWSQNMKNGILLDSEIDLYRAQEVAFGHAPFIDKEIIGTGDDQYDLNEYNLVTPVALRYATAHATSIQYLVNGNWLDSSDAYRQGYQQGTSYQVVLVTYDNGLQVLANSSANDVQWNGQDIPSNGWYATGDGLQDDGTLIKDGTRVDYVNSPERIYAHVRGNSVVDFGTLKTNGSVLLTHDKAGQWTLRVFSNPASTTLSFNSAQLKSSPEIHCARGATGTVKPELQSNSWSYKPIPDCTAYSW